MFERFSTTAREVVERAVAVAAESRASQVRPEHLFAALLWDGDSLAARVLVDLGADLAVLRAELDRRRARYVDGLDDEDAAALASIGIDLAEVVGRIEHGLPPGRRRRAGFSRASKKVLELSLREAISLGHGHIGSEHLLLGLVREGDVIVRDSFAAAGVETALLRPAIERAVRRAG